MGKTKEDWLKQALDHYHQRLQPLISLEIVTLPDVSIKTANNPVQVKHKEANQIIKIIKVDEYVILLDEQGTQYNSFEFAAELNRLSDKKIVFVIGGIYGTDPELKPRANLVMSLSRFTLTHQMVRVVLAEQIYRAMMINHNRSYHY